MARVACTLRDKRLYNGVIVLSVGNILQNCLALHILLSFNLMRGKNTNSGFIKCTRYPLIIILHTPYYLLHLFSLLIYVRSQRLNFTCFTNFGGSCMSSFRPQGVPGPTSKLSLRVPAQMGRRETEHKGKQ
jgi:hypothetical protein